MLLYVAAPYTVIVLKFYVGLSEKNLKYNDRSNEV